ncbi:hypothetical protein TNCV_2627751 [Trichonephila clavipes]|uniref:Uncharacterized protein n=1 Tax=Trichonephila clavipes TaxID=2585209 RepID=A0A8X6W7L4_TRICX|nr:hypothetical protein TNCV_2627751 [Trichonephila clavipes]
MYLHVKRVNDEPKHADCRCRENKQRDESRINEEKESANENSQVHRMSPVEQIDGFPSNGIPVPQAACSMFVVVN